MVSFGGVAIGEIGFAADLVSASTRLYLLDSDNGALYKSVDGGTVWTDISPAGVFPATVGALGVSGGNDLVVVADSSGNVKVSNNGGTSWADVTDWQAGGPEPLDISIVDANTWIFASEITSRRTTNAGSSWADDPAAAVALRVKAAAGGAKIWGTEFGDDTKTKRYALNGTGAETFSRGTDRLRGLAICSDALAFAINDEFPNQELGALWAVNGAGISSVVPSGTMTDAYFCAAMAPADGTLIWLALCWDFNVSSTPSNVGQLWRSTNSGVSWTKVKEDHALQPQTHFQGRGIAVDPSDSLKWWACGGNGYDLGDATLFASVDGGVTWTSSVPVAGSRYLGAIVAVSG